MRAIFILSFCKCFAVYAAVLRLIFICQDEDMRKLLLGSGDATGIMATDNVNKLLGENRIFLLDQLAVADNIHCNTRGNVSEDVCIDIDRLCDLDYILLAHFSARGVLDDRNVAIKLIKTEKVIDLHTLTGGNVVDYYTVFNRIYLHIFLLKAQEA